MISNTKNGLPSLMNEKEWVDQNKWVDQNNWAVTLTCDKGRFDFHARLFFEGMTTEKPESYFYRVAHLTGNKGSNPAGPRGCFLGPNCGNENIGQVEIDEPKKRENFKVRYGNKSETWVRSREKVEALLGEIEKERLGGHPFFFFGGKALGAKKAEIFNIYDPLLSEVYNLDAKLFLRLYDSAQNSGECTGMSQKEFDQAIAEIQKPINKLFPTEKLTYASLIERTLNFSEKLSKSQQSCITWSLDKLEILDIKLASNQLEKLISITTFYTSQKAENCANSCLISKPLKPNKWEGHKIYKRFVTYDIDRDRRTEEWKEIEEKVEKNHRLARVADLTGLSVASTFGIAAFAAPFLLASAPLAAGLAIGGFLVGALVPYVAERFHSSAKEKQDELMKEISANDKFKQAGNNFAQTDEIEPYFLERWRKMNAEGLTDPDVRD